LARSSPGGHRVCCCDCLLCILQPRQDPRTFRVARLDPQQAPADASSDLTHTGLMMGTPDFIAPEQVARRPVTIQTDVFNLGATMYWTITGRHIPTLYTVNKKGENSFLLDTRIDAPADLNPKTPAAYSNLILEMISTNSRKRPQDMDEVITRLELGKHILQKQQNPVTSQPMMGDTD
jgi:serine/threonine protein kinase